jgi:Na+-transporting methylmalonyl-CoA/oxaloacetate decarboxylase gamma subunit
VKKYLLFSLMALLIALMAACGEATTTEEEETPADEASATAEAHPVDDDDTEAEESAEEVEEPTGANVADVIESDTGVFTLVAKAESDELYVSGPIEVVVPEVKVVHAVTDGELKDMYEKDELVYVSVHLEVANTSEDTNSYP